MYNLVSRLVRKAGQSKCMFKVAAVGFSKKGNLLGITTNRSRFSKHGGGLHAERLLINRHKGALSRIIICRVGRDGDLLPIDPCEQCQKLAAKYGIKIETVEIE